MALFNKKKPELLTELPEVLPQHIGIIMDGNGRWAKKNGLPRKAGHKKGYLHGVGQGRDSLHPRSDRHAAF